MKTQEHVVAFVEPTLDGESALKIAQETVKDGGRATVVVLVSRQTMTDVRAFAESENLTVPDATAIYFDRLASTYASRLGNEGASAVVTESVYSGRYLFDVAARANPTTIVMPQRLANRRGWRSFVGRSHVPVLITPSVAAAA
ncbi:MAG: hypothetical protein WBO84_03090 [Acidimicrobiia bacterium]